MRILPLSDIEVTCLQQEVEPAFKLTYCDSKSGALFPLYVIYFSIDKGFPGNSAGKESACNAGDPGSVPGLGRSAGEGIGYPLQYSCTYLVVQLVKNSPAMWDTWIQSLGWEDPLEKGLATYSSIRPGEFHGLCTPWGNKELDRTE